MILVFIKREMKIIPVMKKIMVLFTFFLALLTGCSSLLPETAEPLPTAIIDKSPFTGVPCSAPCWHGLVIGKSSDKRGKVDTIGTTLFRSKVLFSTYHRGDVTGLRIGNKTYPGISDLCGLCTPLSTMLRNYRRRKYPRSNRHHVKLPNLSGRGHCGFGASRLCWVSALWARRHITCQVELVWYSKQLVLNSAPVTWETSNPNDECIIVRDTHKTTSDLIISGVSYMSTAWLDGTLANGGSQFFKFSGTIPGK